MRDVEYLNERIKSMSCLIVFYVYPAWPQEARKLLRWNRGVRMTWLKGLISLPKSFHYSDKGSQV